MIIDIFPHILPPRYLKALRDKTPPNLYTYKWVEAIPTLSDIDLRFKIMDKYDGLVQVLTIGSPPIEKVVSPKDAIELAKIANDEMAALVAKYPDRFVAAVACLPMSDIDAALKETDRAITELKFRGIQLYSDINETPIDSTEILPLYEKMAHYNLPILLHPQTEPSILETANKNVSKQAWVIFGWPFQTTLAMCRIVFGGIFDKYPDLKIITHHCGAMFPFFEARLAGSSDLFEKMGQKHGQYLSKRPVDYFRLFMGDTALYGNTPALMCAHSILGADHILFGTDMPYDNQIGYRHVRETIISVMRMNIPEYEKKMIFEDNAKRIMRLPV